MKYTKSHLGVLNEYIYLCSELVPHRETVCEPLDYYGSRGQGITNYIANGWIMHVQACGHQCTCMCIV